MYRIPEVGAAAKYKLVVTQITKRMFREPALTSSLLATSSKRIGGEDPMDVPLDLVLQWVLRRQRGEWTKPRSEAS